MRTMTPDRQVHILPDAEGVARASAAFVVGAAAEDLGSLAATHFRIALAGGTTPRRLYELLAEGELLVSWDRWEVFWGDERLVPPADPLSNHGMARQALLDRVPIPPRQIHPIPVDLVTPDVIAAQYQDTLRSALGAAVPAFDLMVLGIGEDGHTGSLFAGSDALAQTDRLVVANWVAVHGDWRITMTLPVLNAARRVVFMATGVGKAQAIRRVLEPSGAEPPVPAALVRPRDGVVHWFIDREAASLLADHNGEDESRNL